MQSKDADTVSDYVDHIRCNRKVHRRAGFSKTAVQSRSRIVNRHCRIGICRDTQIRHACRHDIILNLAEHQTHQLFVGNQYHYRNNNRQQYRCRQKLGSCRSRLLLVLLSDILADDHRTAGCQRCEQVDKDHIKRIDQ